MCSNRFIYLCFELDATSHGTVLHNQEFCAAEDKMRNNATHQRLTFLRFSAANKSQNPTSFGQFLVAESKRESSCSGEPCFCSNSTEILQCLTVACDRCKMFVSTALAVPKAYWFLSYRKQSARCIQMRCTE